MANYFVSSNRYKFTEYDRIFSKAGSAIVHFEHDVDEIQTLDVNVIIKDKAVKAYSRVRRPVIVEHSSLSLPAWGGLPKGLSKPFWEKLIDHICDIASHMPNSDADMTACLAVCDGRKIHIVSHTVAGRIAKTVSKSGTFHLDRIFVPERAKKCLADMSESDRDQRSPRAEAVRELLRYIP